MKLSLKIFLSTVSLCSVLLSLGGFFVIAYGFEESLQREYDRVYEDTLHTRFSFETSVINISPNKAISDDELISITKQLSQNGLYDNYSILFLDENDKIIYSSDSYAFDYNYLFLQPAGTELSVRHDNNLWSIYAASAMPVNGRSLTMHTTRDITEIFITRQDQLNLLCAVICSFLIFGGIGIFLLSVWITKPLRRVSAVSKNIAGGDYQQRILVKSTDEIGQLAFDFNRMADSIQDKIIALENASRQKEDFVANFAHELKTPLTSIIGYADMLRSKQLDDETAFKASNYIYNEGKRLENLSLKLMDMLVLQHQPFPLRLVNGSLLIELVVEAFEPIAKESGLTLVSISEDGVFKADPDLIKTLLYNLLDNARKASESNGALRIIGEIEGTNYKIRVEDDGCGIAQDEICKLTEPFYMADKSRSRKQHGAGLGLSLCSEIAGLHNAQFIIESKIGKGTSVSLLVPLAE